MVAPTSFSIRMYNVGFGDCFLLTFDYGTDVGNQPTNSAGTAVQRRHILFDHGSTSRARTRLSLAAIAKQVATDTDGKLDAVVVTHRHKDHLSGFGTKAGKAILDLRPDLVVRSWTEDPVLQKDAGKPVSLARAGASIGAATGIRATNVQYLSTIAAGEQMAASIVRRAAEAGRSRTNLAQAADDAVTNAAAVDALAKVSGHGAGEYLYSGRKEDGTYRTTRLESMLPGVKIHVLGPPRPSDWPDVIDQAEESSEFWTGAPTQVRRVFGEPTGSSESFGTAARNGWLDHRSSSRGRTAPAPGLVRWLDDVLNNTSVILLFEVGDHKLLFCGDAQIENWSWALKQAEDDPALRQTLAGGHRLQGRPSRLTQRDPEDPLQPLEGPRSAAGAVHRPHVHEEGRARRGRPRRPTVDARHGAARTRSTRLDRR